MNTTFLTATDVAGILKISKALAYRLISNGEIVSVRFGRTVRITSFELENFIKKNVSNADTNNKLFDRSERN